MSFENINLWFAKDINDEIITIDKITEDNKYLEYKCPICKTDVIPKCGNIMSHHFSHKNGNNCNSETMIHFFVKNELIKVGDKFKICVDKKSKDFVCKEVYIEKKYETEHGCYKPDITILTDDGDLIHFEIAHTNRKRIEDYLDKWIDLGNIIVEINTKSLLNGKDIKLFDAIYFENKCFNIQNEEKEYYEMIGKVKLNKSIYPIDEVNKLHWLWKDINKYLDGTLEISELSDEIQAIENNNLREVVVDVLRKNRCKPIMDDYINYNINNFKKKFKMEKVFNSCDINTDKCRLVYDRIYHGFKLDIRFKGIIIFNKEVNYNFDKNEIIVSDNILNYMKLYEYSIEKYNIPINYKEGWGYCFTIFNNQFDLSNDYEDCIKFIDESISNNEKLMKHVYYIDSNFNIIKNEFDNILTEYTYSDDKEYICLELNIQNIKEKINIKININKNINYYISEIYSTLKCKFKDILLKLYNNMENKPYIMNLYSPYKDIIYMIQNGEWIPVKIEFKLLKNYDTYLKDLINNCDRKIESYTIYKELLYDYYLKCKNTKNNYYMTLLENSLTIYYKENKIETIKFSDIDDINNILQTNKNLNKAIIEDIKDYNSYSMMLNMIENINIRYSKINGNWRIKIRNEDICLYDKDRYICKLDIEIPFINEAQFTNYLIDKISNEIRSYIYE